MFDDMQRTLTEAAGAGGLDRYFSTWTLRSYGYDRPARRYPATGGDVDGTFSILFVGDSITEGYDVRAGAEDYPALVFQSLRKAHQVEVINAGVRAFGFDQIVLKATDMVEVHKPDLLIVAYIPHDLRRAGRDVYYGVPKPLFRQTENHRWRLDPAPKVSRFYRDFVDSREQFRWSIWSMKHVADNRCFYFYYLCEAHYSGLFSYLLSKLEEIAEAHAIEVLIVNLAGFFGDERSVDFLEPLAEEAFASNEHPLVSYVSAEGCLRRQARAAGVDYDRVFVWHPPPIGHRLYATCITPYIRQRIARAQPSREGGSEP